MSLQTKIIAASFLVVLVVASRLIPHLSNFVPIIAIALFAGVYLGERYAVAVALVSAVVSDLFLGTYEWQIMLSVYFSYAVAALLSAYVTRYKSVVRIGLTSLIASVFFFLVTNWAVWQFTTFYAPDLPGLMSSYAMALPFFRNSLIADISFTYLFFGLYEGYLYLARRQRAKAFVN